MASRGLRVATGEHCYSRFGFRDLLENGAAHIIQPDLVYTGGFMEAKKIAAMAEAHYVSVAPHNPDGTGKMAASIHLSANIPNFLVLESFAHFDVPWLQELTGDVLEFDDGCFKVPEGPGWGFEVDEGVARKHPGSTECKLNMFSDDWEKSMCK